MPKHKHKFIETAFFDYCPECGKTKNNRFGGATRL